LTGDGLVYNRRALRRLALLAAFVLCAGSAPGASSKKEIAVMEMTADGGADPQVGAQITARIADILGKNPGVHVIAPDDIRALLEKEAKRQLLGCDGEGCLTEIVGALGADLVIKGRISKIEDGYGLSLSAVDAQRARAIGHVSETWKGESIALLDLVIPMMDKLLSEAPEKLVGSIEINGAASGSQILIDDQVRGTAPAGQMGNIPVGARRVRVVAGDYEPFDRWVVVKTNELVTVPVQQKAIPSSVIEKWWFWTGLALLAGGAATGIYFATRGGSGGSAGATGVDVAVNTNDAFTHR
jgi:hypothetical protein